MGRLSEAAKTRREKSDAALKCRYKKKPAAAAIRRRRAPGCTPRMRVCGQGSDEPGGAAGAAAAPQQLPQWLTVERAMAPLPPKPEYRGEYLGARCDGCHVVIGTRRWFETEVKGVFLCESCWEKAQRCPW